MQVLFHYSIAYFHQRDRVDDQFFIEDLTICIDDPHISSTVHIFTKQIKKYYSTTKEHLSTMSKEYSSKKKLSKYSFDSFRKRSKLERATCGAL